MNNLIICSGDSFTAGDELAGDLLVPGYTSNLYVNQSVATDDRKKIFQKLQKETSKLWYSLKDRIQYEQECKNRAWPAHLKKLLTDTEVINCAGPGLSNEEIVHRAIETYFQNKNNFQNIKIIIMVTTYNRFGTPLYDQRYATEYEYLSYTIQHGDRKLEPDYLESEFNNFFFRIKDYDRLVRSMFALSFCKNFFESNNIPIYFIDSCLWESELEKFEFEHKEKVLYFKNIIPLLCKMTDVEVTNVLPGFHFAEQTHKDFAAHVKKLI